MKIIDNQFLLKYMKQAGLNYSEVSKRTDISRSTLYNIMWGKNCPSYSVMSILANSLEFTQAEFIAIFFPNVKFRDESAH